MDSSVEKSADALQVAAQLGRLDFVSAMLAAIGIALVLAGIFAFLNLRDTAKKVACDEAAKNAKVVAERVTNEYLQAELPDLLEAYAKFLNNSAGPDEPKPKGDVDRAGVGDAENGDIADRIAGAQEE